MYWIAGGRGIRDIGRIGVEGVGSMLLQNAHREESRRTTKLQLSQKLRITRVKRREVF